MKQIRVLCGILTDTAGKVLDEDVDTFTGPDVAFLTESSGVLVVLEDGQTPNAVYAPGQWLKAHYVDQG